MFNKKALPSQLSLMLPTVNAGTGATFAIFNPQFAGEIVSVNVANHVNLATDANSFFTLALIDNTTTTHTLASIANGSTGSSFVLDQFRAMTLAATNTNKRFAAGDAIVFNKAETGAGCTLTTPTLWIEYIGGVYDS